MQLDLSLPPAAPSPKSVLPPPHLVNLRPTATRKRRRHSHSMSPASPPPAASSSSLPLPQKRAADHSVDHHDVAYHLPNLPSSTPKVKKRRNWAPIAIVPMKNIAIPSNLPADHILQLKLHYRSMSFMEQQIFGVSTLLSLVKYALKGSADLKKIAALGRRLSKTRKRFLNVQRGIFDVQNERNASAVIPQHVQTAQNRDRKTAPKSTEVQDVSPETDHPPNASQSNPLQLSSSHSHGLDLSSAEKNEHQQHDEDHQQQHHHHHQVDASETCGPSTQINTNNGGEDQAHPLSNLPWNSPDCTTSFSPNLRIPMPVPVASSGAARNHFQAPTAFPPHNQHQNVLHHHHQQNHPCIDLNNLTAIDTREIAASYNHNHSNINMNRSSQNHHPAPPQQQRTQLVQGWFRGVSTFDGDHNPHNVPNMPTIASIANAPPHMANVSKIEPAHHHLASHFPPVPKMASAPAYNSHALSEPMQHASEMDANAISISNSHGGAKMIDKIDTAELASHDHSQSQFTLPDFSPVTPISIPPQRGSLANWEASYTSSMTNAMGGTPTPQSEIHLANAHSAVFDPSQNANLRMANNNGHQASMFGQYGQLRELMGLSAERGGDLGSFVNQQSEAAFFSAHN